MDLHPALLFAPAGRISPKKTPTTRMGGYFRKRSPHAPCTAASMDPRTPRSPNAGTKKGAFRGPLSIRAIEPYGYLLYVPVATPPSGLVTVIVTGTPGGKRALRPVPLSLIQLELL